MAWSRPFERTLFPLRDPREADPDRRDRSALHSLVRFRDRAEGRDRRTDHLLPDARELIRRPGSADLRKSPSSRLLERLAERSSGTFACRRAPYLFSGARISLNLALIGAVIGEWTGADRGLGRVIFVANANLDLTILSRGVLVSRRQSVSRRTPSSARPSGACCTGIRSRGPREAVALLVAALLVACNAPAAAPIQSPSPIPVEKVTFIAGFKPQADLRSSRCICAGEGLLPRPSLEVEIQHATQGEHVQLLATDRAQFSTVCRGRRDEARGKRRRSARGDRADRQRDEQSFAVRADSPIRTLKDWEESSSATDDRERSVSRAHLGRRRGPLQGARGVAVGFDPRVLADGRVDVYPSSPRTSRTRSHGSGSPSVSSTRGPTACPGLGSRS